MMYLTTTAIEPHNTFVVMAGEHFRRFKRRLFIWHSHLKIGKESVKRNYLGFRLPKSSSDRIGKNGGLSHE